MFFKQVSDSNYTPTLRKLVENYESCLTMIQGVDVESLGRDKLSSLIQIVSEKEFDPHHAYNEGGEDMAKLCILAQTVVQRLMEGGCTHDFRGASQDRSAPTIHMFLLVCSPRWETLRQAEDRCGHGWNP